MDRYIGKLLDNRYEILERIGTGGMAMVYKARCHRLNRLVAIKILKEELAQDAEFRRRFHDESKAVAMLSHPNIVAVYDVSRASDIDYIVMELIDGITLKQYIQKRGGKLSWREALHFITQIMKGLSHAHSRGIIHRDIKPHNIMVLRDGSIKVADFGIARLTSAAQSTLTQEALGSVHYISPEQAKGSRIDARSDVYSAGVVLYEMITGRLPYEGDSPVAVAIQHINSVPLSPREIDPEIPEALEAITMKAMASDTNRRYLSADAMLADLEEFRKNPNINFDYTMADLSVTEGDEPTQVLGANTPIGVHGRPAHPIQDTSSRSRARRVPREPIEEEEEDTLYGRDRSRGINWSVIAGIGIVLLFLVGVGFVLYLTLFSSIFGKEQTYSVPRVLDMTIDQAKSKAQETGFKIEEGDAVYNDAPVGQIIAQSPEADTEVKAGDRVIRVTLSAGIEAKPTMPSVEGQRIELARNTLQSMNLRLDIREEEVSHETAEEGTVVEQFPVQDTELTEGQVVTLKISKGPKIKKITVISFEGMSLNEALGNIGTEENQLNLRPKIERVYNDNYPEDYIIAQSIPNTTSVEEGSTIVFTVSRGPNPEVTPSPSPTPSPTPEPTPTPIPTPTPTPVPTPTPTPEPTPTPAQQPVTKGIDIPLPQDQETVNLRIEVDGVVMRDETIATSVGFTRFNATGTGSKVIVVYINGQEVLRDTLEFT